MPENKKVENEKTRAETYLIYFGMFITFLTSVGYPTLKQLFPEIMETNHERELAHEEALKVALEFPEEIGKKYRHDSARYSQELARLHSEVRYWRGEFTKLDDIIKGMDKRERFNTYQIGVNSEAIYRTMRIPEVGCELDHRSGYHENDRFILFDDWYEIKTIQPIQIGGGCSAYIYPFDRNRIQIK